MRRKVVLTRDAERDLEDIYRYIVAQDTKASADHVLDRLLQIGQSLEETSERGSVPRELDSLGIRDYRQIHFKPYRLIYRVHAEKVVIYLIADGRRDMQSLLTRRLLAP